MPAGRAWTSTEERELCRAWVYRTRNAAQGTDQKMDDFWDGIAKTLYDAMVRSETEYQCRTTKAIRNKFGHLQHQVTKFTGHYSRATRTRASGMSDEDVFSAALTMFERKEGVEFRNRDCWDLLRCEPKFMGSVADSSRQLGQQVAVDATAAQDVTRPIGQKKAKEARLKDKLRSDEINQLRRLADAVSERNKLLEVQTGLALMTQTPPDDPDAKAYLALMRRQFLDKARGKRRRAAGTESEAEEDEEEKEGEDNEDPEFEFQPTALV